MSYPNLPLWWPFLSQHMEAHFPFVQTKQSGVTLDLSLSITQHMQSVCKSHGTHFQNIPRIQSFLSTFQLSPWSKSLSWIIKIGFKLASLLLSFPLWTVLTTAADPVKIDQVMSPFSGLCCLPISLIRKALVFR